MPFLAALMTLHCLAIRSHGAHTADSAATSAQSSALASALVAGKSIRIEDVGRDCDQAWRVHRLKKGFRCLPMFLGVPNFPVSFALFPIAARRTLHEVSEPALDNEVLLEQVLCTEGRPCWRRSRAPPGQARRLVRAGINLLAHVYPSDLFLILVVLLGPLSNHVSEVCKTHSQTVWGGGGAPCIAIALSSPNARTHAL